MVNNLGRFPHHILIIMICLLTGNAFGAQPPKVFMDAVIYAGDNPSNSERYGAMSDFIKCLKGNGNTTKWELAGKSWILHTTKKDNLTKSTTKIAWEFVFDKQSPFIVALGRVLVGKEVITDSLSIMQNFQGCWDQPTWDTKKNVLMSMQIAKSVYSESGLSGIKAQVTSCYDDADKYMKKSNLKMMTLERCLGLDVAGHTIDVNAQNTLKFPADPFFEKDSLIERSTPIFDYYPKDGFNEILDGLIELANQNL